MRQLFDGSGRPVTPIGLIGKGGEGSVYSIAERDDLVAKIYHEAPTPHKSAKLVSMATLQTPALLEMTAWPMETLHTNPEGSGSIVGLLMRKVVGYKEAHALYSPKSRRTEFANASWRFLIHAASNVARAFARVHEHNHVIGDVNHGNVMISAQATVMMIDCDSFQVRESQGTVFLCEVGVPTYTAPELQGQILNRIARTVNHDNFGLAVLIFHLLFMGRHPFAGRFLGHGDMPIETAIQQHRFAFGADGSQTLMQPPPNTLPLVGISPDLAMLFLRAFSKSGSQPGARPTAPEWVYSLDALKKQLKRCSVNSAHDYLNSLRSCPWCDIEKKTGSVLFSVQFVTAVAPQDNFEISSAWSRIVAVGPLSPAPPLPTAAAFTVSLQASAEAKARGHQRRIANRVGLVITSLPTCLLILGALDGYFWFWISVVSAFVWILALRAVSTSEEKAYWTQVAAAANCGCQSLERNWHDCASGHKFIELQKKLEACRQEYNSIPATRQKLLQNLEADREKAQFRKYLETTFLQLNSVPGIGPGRMATLASYGIETAADITEAALDPVPGFGPSYTQRLLSWRRNVERKFVFNPAIGVDPAQIQSVEASIASRRHELEQRILKGPEELTSLKETLTNARNEISLAFEAQMRLRIQAELNRDAL